MLKITSALALFAICCSALLCVVAGADSRCPPVDPEDPDDITYYPYPGDCTLYLECAEGDIVVRNCPAGLWWNEAIKRCDYPGSYCYGYPDPPTEPPHGTGRDPRCINYTTDYLPHPRDCNKYIECYNQESYEMVCPSGLFFSIKEKDCVNPVDSECCITSSVCT